MKQEKIYTVEIDEWNKRQMEELFAEIECSHNWKSIEKIAKGWSSDEKYKVITKQGENLLIRLASIDKYEEKKKEFDIITKPTNTKIEKKILQLSRYESSKVGIANDETAVKYVKENICKIWKEKPVYQHGNFHPGNLIYMENGEIGVIDFNRWEVGDPYEEFYKLESFAREKSIPYCIGQIKEYFNDNVPIEFWDILAVYVAHASLFKVSKWHFENFIRCACIIVMDRRKSRNNTSKISEGDGESVRTIKREMSELKEKWYIRRINGKRNGKWEVLIKIGFLK